MIKPKQKLYKTAYSLVQECFVGIEHAYQDVDGRWIYQCTSPNWEGYVLHREEELTGLTL